jgi:type I site-specific restriction endonuclease
MDMKKILQAIDSGSTKPVGNSNDMKKFLSVVTEGANPHKVALPVQMAMQHYSTPTVAQPRTIKEVKKTAMSSMLYQYYTEAEQQLAEEDTAKKEIISEQARRIAQRVLAKEGAQQAAIAIAKKASGKYNKDGKRIKESFNPEYDDEAGMAQGSLHTLQNAVEGLQQVIDSGDNLPEWCQEKISLAEDYLVTVWDYIQSEKAQGVDPEINETRYGRQSAYDRDVAASQDFSRGHDHRGLEQELAHETNNYAVSINGKQWKVFGSRQEANRVSNAMERKYPDKKIGVHATGAPVSEGIK